MYESVAKLPCGEVTVAKLPCGEVTGNRCGDSRKMCWGVGGGRRDVGRDMKGGVGKCDGVWGR